MIAVAATLASFVILATLSPSSALEDTTARRYKKRQMPFLSLPPMFSAHLNACSESSKRATIRR